MDIILETILVLKHGFEDPPFQQTPIYIYIYNLINFRFNNAFFNGINRFQLYTYMHISQHTITKQPTGFHKCAINGIWWLRSGK